MAVGVRKVEYRDIDTLTHEVAFVCAPLRLTVFIHAIFCCIAGVIFYLYRSSWNIQFFGGGYTFMSHIFLSFSDALGVLAGIVGAVGAWKMKSKYTGMFYHYQYMRLALYVFSFMYDRPIMYNCEGWIVDVDGTMKTYGWNPVLFDIAFKGNCLNERFSHLIWTMSIFFLCVYLTWVSYRFQIELEKDAVGFLYERPNSQLDEEALKNGTFDDLEEPVISDATFVGWTVNPAKADKGLSKTASRKLLRHSKSGRRLSTIGDGHRSSKGSFGTTEGVPNYNTLP